jgi:hypothetical protein
MADESLFATTWDTRTALIFRLPHGAIEKLLPPGWESTPLADGANLQLLFAESVLTRYADGKSDGNERVVTWVIPAKKKDRDEKGALVVGGFISTREKAPGPYGVWPPAANATLTRSSSVSVNGKLQMKEAWEFTSEAGDKLSFELEFERGPLSYSKLESKVFSSVKDFFRIYRVEQASETIAINDPRIRRISFKAEGLTLSRVFDGSEQLVSVVSVPRFSRQIFLPH